MSDTVVQNDEDQVPPLSTSAHALERSYQPYAWSVPNRLLDIIDEKTHGRAGLMQRSISYLFFGGLAAAVNLLVFGVMFHYALTSLQPAFLRNTLSYIIAAEISILANFIPNDHFTFNKLPGAKRPWLVRCLRFHLTAVVGTCLTYVIELTFSNFLHLDAVLAEAIAIVIVLIYNFTFHHVFTYGHIKHS